MAYKNKEIEAHFRRLSKVYEEIMADDHQRGLLDDLDGDHRILAHAVFYLVSKALAKKLEGMAPFELLRILEERMLRVFITDPNSQRVDDLLEKADLLYELLPYMISDCLHEDETYEEYPFPEEALYAAQGLLAVAVSYSIGADDDDHLDLLLDSLSLHTGKVGSPMIEADAAELMEIAKRTIHEGDYEMDEENEAEGATIAQLRDLDLDRQMLVIGLLSINMDGFSQGMACWEARMLRDDVEDARDAFDGGESPEAIEECVEEVIESIQDVVDYLMDENRPSDFEKNIYSFMFTGVLTVFIHNAHDLSDEDFAEVWSEVHPEGKFDDEALIAYSRKIVDRDLPLLLEDFKANQK